MFIRDLMTEYCSPFLSEFKGLRNILIIRVK